ncbi:MAG: hypothetical protein ACTSWI_06985 [Alphaproteobacteria bacterium]
MPSSHSLSGLMKWLAGDAWRQAFLNVLDRHIGRVLDEHDIPNFDELGDLIDPHWAMTLWGCAFEDFLTTDVEGVGNIVDDYLKRRGWKETTPNREYMSGLKDTLMSLYEVSDIQPGRSFLARDLIRGGEPVRVSERTATKTLKRWDRLAMRIVDVRGTRFIGGGLLPFEHELSERLIAAISCIENQLSTDTPEIIDELSLDRTDPELDRLMGMATNKADPLQDLAPAFSSYFLSDLLERMESPAVPQMTNSDGDEIEFMRLVYRLSESVTPEQVRGALDRAPNLDAASETFWNWLEPNTARKMTRNASRSLKFVTTTGEGSTVLGTIELKSRTIELCVNSEIRADRGRKMLETLLDGLAGAPLVERQTLEQALSEDREQESGSSSPELPSDVRREIIHDTMDRHYRTQLDEPVPALGNISPRRAARSKKGRGKLLAWLKLLENQTATHDADDPLASYDFTWIWQELGVSHLRN